MFERRRSPIAISLHSNWTASSFWIREGKNFQDLLFSDEQKNKILDLDLVNFSYSEAMIRHCCNRNTSREVGFAASTLSMSMRSFSTISTSMAAKDLLSAFSSLRSCIEGIARAGQVVCVSECARETLLYGYENGFRDSHSRARNWVGCISEQDSYPTKLGKVLSNPLLDDGAYDTGNTNGRYELLKTEPTFNSDRKMREELSFGKIVQDLILDPANCVEIVTLAKEWHKFSCSFAHADAFAISLFSMIDEKRGKSVLRDILIEIATFLTLFFSSVISKLLIEINAESEARHLDDFREKRIS